MVKKHFVIHRNKPLLILIKERRKNINNIEKEKFNPEENEKWTAPKEPKEEEQISSEKGEWTPTVEGGKKIEEEKEEEEKTTPEKTEELTPKEREIIEQEEREKERALREIREIDNWRELQRKGLLTEKGARIMDKLEEQISEIEQKTKMLTIVRDDMERYKAQREKGIEVVENIYQETEQDLRDREEGFKKLEIDYEFLKKELRELEQRGELVKKVEPEKEEEVSEEAEAVEEKEEKKSKGFFGMFRKKK